MPGRRREEQLRARITPTQTQPFFIADLLALASYIVKWLMEGDLLPKEIYVFARVQAYFKTFFAGDRAGDLGKMKSEEMLYFPKEGLLFNHVLTKSLRDGTSNLFSLNATVRMWLSTRTQQLKHTSLYAISRKYQYAKVTCLDPHSASFVWDCGF